MAGKKVGTLIREARTEKKMSQEQLAAEVDGLSGSDIGKAERGEKELSQAQLKQIAKALGVTQKSLLEAPKGGSAPASSKTSSAKKTTASKTASSAKSAAASKKTSSSTKTGTASKKTSGTKTSGSSTAKKPAASSAKSLTAAEEKFLELYRAADADAKKLAGRILKGEKHELGDMLPMLMNAGSTGDDGLLGALLGKLQNFAK